MNINKKYIIAASLLMLLLLSMSATIIIKGNIIKANNIDRDNELIISDERLISFMIDRANYMNKKAVSNRRLLRQSDLASDKEIRNRVHLIIDKSHKYNYMYPNIDYKRVALDYFAIVEHETAFINYQNLDNGLSGGIISMQFATAKIISRNMDMYYNKTKFINDMEYQISLGIIHYYDLLREFDGNRRDAWTAYNTGRNWKIDNHWLDYTFQVGGRIDYYNDILGIN